MDSSLLDAPARSMTRTHIRLAIGASLFSALCGIGLVLQHSRLSVMEQQVEFLTKQAGLNFVGVPKKVEFTGMIGDENSTIKRLNEQVAGFVEDPTKAEVTGIFGIINRLVEAVNRDIAGLKSKIQRFKDQFATRVEVTRMIDGVNSEIKDVKEQVDDFSLGSKDFNLTLHIDTIPASVSLSDQRVAVRLFDDLGDVSGYMNLKVDTANHTDLKTGTTRMYELHSDVKLLPSSIQVRKGGTYGWSAGRYEGWLSVQAGMWCKMGTYNFSMTRHRANNFNLTEDCYTDFEITIHTGTPKYAETKDHVWLKLTSQHKNSEWVRIHPHGAAFWSGQTTTYRVHSSTRLVPSSITIWKSGSDGWYIGWVVVKAGTWCGKAIYNDWLDIDSVNYNREVDLNLLQC